MNLKFFVVTDHDRWGFSVNVVQAENPDEARRLVNPKGKPERVEVEVLEERREPGILWTHDESPDTPRRGS